MTRLLRVSIFFVLVVGVELRVLDPWAVSRRPDLAPLPWAFLALLFPMALGVWAFEVTTVDTSRLKADLLWGVLLGTLCYVAALLWVRHA